MTHGTWFWIEDPQTGNRIRVIVDAEQPKGVAYYSAGAVSVPVAITEDELVRACAAALREEEGK